MATPENTMLNLLKKKLEADLEVEIEKTNNMYRGGRPDWDLFIAQSARGRPARIVFVEGKHWPKQTEVGNLESTNYVWTRMCSALQRAWLKRKAKMGFFCFVLCGFDTKNNYLFFLVGPEGPHISVAGVMNYEQLRDYIKILNN